MITMIIHAYYVQINLSQEPAIGSDALFKFEHGRMAWQLCLGV